ncbi:hypothetical protein HaLaN_23792, partial [Haematococcus lacustris]
MLGSSPGGGPGGAAGKGGGALGTGTMARGQGGDCLSRNSQATNDGDLAPLTPMQHGHAGTSKLGKLGGISLRHRQTHSVHSSMEVPSTHFMEGVSCTHHFNRDELV